MQIIVNGLPAVIKKGTSIEYVSENPLFGGADGYSFSITFPLRGCSENRAIFGHLDRVDAQAHTTLIRNCEIVDRKLTLSGALAVTEITETEVKAQFLQGRSVQNFDASFDDIYIDELDLGLSAHTCCQYRKEGQWDQDDPDQWGYIDIEETDSNLREVSLSYITPDGEFRSRLLGSSLTHAQHFLANVIKAICQSVGYTVYLQEYLATQQFKYLLVCNTLPLAWGIENYARALPHWTVSEFFEKLELFLAASFDIDHQNKIITFSKWSRKLATIPDVELADVANEITTEVTVDHPDVDYLPMTNLCYSERDDQTYKFDCCPNFKPEGKQISVNGIYDLKEHLSTSFYYDQDEIPDYCQYIYNTTAFQTRRHVLQVTNRVKLSEQDPDTGQIRVWNRYFTIPRPIGFHNPRIVNHDIDATTTELDFVPARIEHDGTGKYWVLFLNYNSYNESSDTSTEDDDDDDTIGQTKTVRALMNADDSSGKTEYYDKIYLGFYPGKLTPTWMVSHPFTVPYYFWRSTDDSSPTLNYHRSDPALVFDLNASDSRFADIRPAIDKRRKTTFKWLTSDQQIPDPNAIYHIKGRRWICEKITATITERGLSDLLKGTFYPIDEA